MHLALASFFLLCLLGLVQCLSSSGTRLLVVTDEDADKDKYSKFWSDLEGRGFQLTHSSPKQDPQLFHLGDRAYDHLLLLPSKLKALGPALTPQLLLDFVKAEGNVLLALSANTPMPSSISSTLLELDISLPPDRDALVIDHFNYDTLSSPEQHDVLVLKPPSSPRKDVKNYFSSDFGDAVLAVPRAVGHTLGNSSPLLSPILRAPSTAYSYNPKEEASFAEDPFAAGSQLNIVSAMQGRNSARFTVLGSSEMLEDHWFGAYVQEFGAKAKRRAVNREFAKKLTAWTFKETGVLKAENVRHYLNEKQTSPKPGRAFNQIGTEVLGIGETNPKMYRIKNDVTYSISLSEYDLDHWKPFTPPQTDNIQLDFTMLSPYHRLNLHPTISTHPSPNSTIYTTSFTLPDHHGIYRFQLDYARPFLTFLTRKDTVTLRHFAHDEYPRSFAISGAYVSIVGMGATVVGWLFFMVVWMFSSRPRAGDGFLMEEDMRGVDKKNQ